MKKVLLVLCLISSLMFSAIPVAQATSALATPKNLKATALSWDSIQLSWDAIKGAQGYAIYYLDEGKYVFMKTVTATTYTDNDISYEQTLYTYKVRAFRISGGKKVYSAYSAAASAFSCAYLPLTVETMSDTTVSIRWTSNGAEGYLLYRAKTGGNYTLLCDTTATTISDQDLLANTSYTYRMKYYNTENGKKVYSRFSPAFTTKTLPGGQKYTYYLFVGNSLIYFPRTAYYFQAIADSQHRYARVMEDMIGGSALAAHLSNFKMKINPTYFQADYVFLQDLGGVCSNDTPKVIQEIRKCFPSSVSFYFLWAMAYPVTADALQVYHRIDPGIPNIKSIELCQYLFEKHSDILFRLPNDYHPNELFGYASALTTYCQLYHADPSTIPHGCVRSELIPGQTKAEKDAFMLDIKLAVKQTLVE